MTTTAFSYILISRGGRTNAAKIYILDFFDSVCKSIGIGDSSIQEVENTLLLNPNIGDMVEGTGGARKMRIRLNGRGKSGGGRIIYYDTGTAIHFLMIYTKKMQADLTPSQKKVLHEITREIRKE